jgi:glycosyltransferase involved in cell wall biosynthesis
MNIIYLTVAMAGPDFISLYRRTNNKPNPSNQNFHNKLITALAEYAHIDVVSLRPLNKTLLIDDYLKEEQGIEGKVKYYYVKEPSSKYERKSYLADDIYALIKRINPKKDYVIMVDSMNEYLVKAALKARWHKKVKVCSILTDSPDNITGTNMFYRHRIKSLNKHFDMYIGLTKELIQLFDKLKKPSYVFEGIIENQEIRDSLLMDNYFFFGGALYEKYGIKNLVEAYKSIKTDVKLVIAGHGELEDYLIDQSILDNRILHLGQIKKEQIYTYASYAYANINPRPISEKINKYSVPSKMLEYLASGKPIISTPFRTFQDNYTKGIIWIKDGETATIKKGLEDMLGCDYEEMKKEAQKNKIKVYKKYDSILVGKNIYSFIKSNSSFSKE